jgi:ABC-type sugar transport system ATPase subunit
VGLVTEDRKRQGLVLPLGVGANVLLGNEPAMARAGFVSARRSRSLVQTMIESLRIKTPSQSTVVGQLSGGNQQKVVLGRWMARRPSVLLIDEPTVGIDIGARSEFYRLLDSYAAEGGACLVVSSDLSEVLDLADRVVVMRGGRSVAEFEGDQMTRQNILESMTVGAA